MKNLKEIIILSQSAKFGIVRFDEVETEK